MKEAKYFLLIPLQLLLMFVIGNVFLLYTDNPVVMQLSTFISILLVFLLAIHYFKDVLKNDWKKISQPVWKIVIYTLLWVVALQVIMNLVYMILPPLPDSPEDMTVYFSDFTPFNKFLFVLFSSGTVLTAVTEELYFRYLFLQRYVRLNKAIGLLVSSILFGLSHYFITFQILECLPYMVMGLAFGGIYLKTKNIWSVIFIHVTTNLIFGLLIFLFQ